MKGTGSITFYYLLWLGALYKLPWSYKLGLIMATGAWVLFCHLTGEEKKRWEERHPDEVHWLDRPYPSPPQSPVHSKGE